MEEVIEYLLKILWRLRFYKLMGTFVLFYKKLKFKLKFKSQSKMCMKILEKYSPNEGKTCITQTNKNEYKYDLDIIIPCYNVESYIRKCVDSVLLQSHHYNCRVILIDDGSTDSTGKIIDEYVDTLSVRIIHQVNSGLSGARNSGLKIVNAKYIMFVDSDDVLPDKAIEVLLNAAEITDSDIISGSYERISMKGTHEKYIRLKTGYLNPKSDLSGYAWGKIYKTQLFEGICFPEHYWFEDTIMRQIIYYRAKSAYGIENIIYKYRRNPHGIVYTCIKYPKVVDTVYVYIQLHEDMKKLGYKYTGEEYEFFLGHVRISMNRMKYRPIRIQRAAFSIWRHMANEIKDGLEVSIDTHSNIECALFNNDFVLGWLDSVFL